MSQNLHYYPTSLWLCPGKMDPLGLGNSINLFRPWIPLGSGVTCRGEMARLCKRPHTEKLDRPLCLQTLHLFAWCQLPLPWPHFPLSGLSVVALVTSHHICNHVSSDDPKASLRACWLIQLEKSKYQERKYKLVCFCLAYLSRESIPALSNVW